MANDNFEKRMEFLKKSYERVPSSFDPDEVFRKIDEEKVPQPTIQKSSKGEIRQRITVWAVSLASIFMIGLIGAGLVLEQKQKSEEEIIQSPVKDEFIENLLKQYEEEREKSREMLKLDEVYFKEYAGYADSKINLLTDESYLKMMRNARSHAHLQEITNEAIEELKLPSEMLKDLKANQLNADEQGSIEFLTKYRQKIQTLIGIYNKILEENREAIEAYEVDASVDKAEIMRVSSKSFPKPLQNIIGTMRDQAIRLETAKFSGDIIARYYNNLSFEELYSKLHHHTDAYMRMIEEEPYMYGPVLEYNIQFSAASLNLMEITLVNVQRDSTLYPILESYFISMFNELLKGSEYTKIFDSNGVLLPEYQEAWRTLEMGGEATPLRYVMMPIVEEMEASGWRKSKSWDRLSYDALKDAIVLAREGVLEEYMYGDRPDFKSETVQLPDQVFDEKVLVLYTDFKRTYDKLVLKGASPIEVLGVFDHANEMEDPETIYHLLHESAFRDESGIDYTLDIYAENWRKSFSLFRNATEARFDSGSVSRYDQIFNGSVYFSGSEKSIAMVYSKEGIWEVGLNRFEHLPYYHRSEEKDFPEEIRYWGAMLYEGLNSTDDIDSYLRWQEPLNIIYMFLYAGKMKDFETQYEMYYQGEGSTVVEKETYVKNPEKYFAPQFDNQLFKTVSFKGQKYDEKGGFYPGVATFTVNKEKYPDEQSTMEFHMIWTEDGWRVKFNPFEQE